MCFSKTYVFLHKSVLAQFFVFFCLSVGREHNFLCEFLHEVAIRGQCCPQSEGYKIPWRVGRGVPIYTKRRMNYRKLGPHDRPSREFRTPRIGDNTALVFRFHAKAHTGNCVRDQHYSRKNTKFGLRLMCVKTRRILKNGRFAELFRFRDQHYTVCNFWLRFGTTPTWKFSILQISEQTLPWLWGFSVIGRPTLTYFLLQMAAQKTWALRVKTSRNRKS